MCDCPCDYNFLNHLQPPVVVAAATTTSVSAATVSYVYERENECGCDHVRGCVMCVMCVFVVMRG